MARRAGVRAGARAATAAVCADELTNQALRAAADRLVDEHVDVRPGSVLRCFARSVRAVLRAGCARSQVVAEAESMTRELLAQRPTTSHPALLPGARSPRDVPRVPRPRRAS